ncbi:MAG: hypothetical protein ACP5VF_13675, partial [Acidobacteriota bacterium]
SYSTVITATRDARGYVEVPVAWVPNATVYVTAVYAQAKAVAVTASNTTTTTTTTVTVTNATSTQLPSAVYVPLGSSVTLGYPSPWPLAVSAALLAASVYVIYRIVRGRDELRTLAASLVLLVIAVLFIFEPQVYVARSVTATYLVEGPTTTVTAVNVSAVAYPNPYTISLYVPLVVVIVLAVLAAALYLVRGVESFREVVEL